MNNTFNDLESTIQQYVLGHLSVKEATEFEAFYLAEPDVIEKIEIAQRLHHGLKKQALSVQGNKTATRKKKQANASLGLVDWLRFPLPAYSFGLLAFAMWTLTYIAPRPDITSNAITMAHFSTSAIRGTTEPPIIDFNNIQTDAAILIKLPRADYQFYRLRLLNNQNNRPIWSSKPFQLTPLRDQMVFVPKNTVSDKAILQVIGIKNDASEVEVNFCHYSENCNPIQ